jgi:hypothetical protein
MAVIASGLGDLVANLGFGYQSIVFVHLLQGDLTPVDFTRGSQTPL